MSKNKRDNLISLICNALIVLCNTFSVIYSLFAGMEGNMTGSNFDVFRYFTFDSNILVAICSGIILYHNIKKIKDENHKIPYYATVLKFVGATSVFLTFITAICFLSIFCGIWAMIEGVNLFLHVTSPILAIVSCTFFEKGLTKFKHTFYGCIPELVYSIVYLPCVVTGTWPDFYNFTFGGHYEIIPIVFIVMVAINYGLGYLMYFVNKKVNKIAK